MNNSRFSRRWAVIVLLALTLLPAISMSQSRGRAAAARKLRVLFIGNSYTYFNNLPQMIEGLAAAARETQKLETEMVATGGATLKRHWEEGKAVEAIRRRGWDYVVLQEQSTLGPSQMVSGRITISDPQAFYEAARLFDAEIRKAGAKTVLFLTWARLNQPEDQAKLNDAYLTMARELKAIIAPVGLAWETALKKNPQPELHLQDKSHPTPGGSYLTACVFYSLLYHKSAVGLPGVLTGDKVEVSGKVISSPNGDGRKAELVSLSRSDATVLQQVAWQTLSPTEPVKK